MDCPRDSVELKELVCRDDTLLMLCETCGGVWIDGSDLNRLLLHNNLPGLETMGGKADMEALSDRCPKCQVDFIVIEGGEKAHPKTYACCESCGGLWFELDLPADASGEEVESEIVEFFKEFRRAGSRTAR